MDILESPAFKQNLVDAAKKSIAHQSFPPPGRKVTDGEVP
jgi:hypothetical protein